ncbi:uncharacterized protein K489DRAFT_380708 [Dissoconium aciculare CBS 342.82]|uniref:Uncharacterized protein n=1 Tax=Dissoconium aciculare CBS 342.82 TaxID=1314786 RepID=A0A6J3M1S8_9PEZI|nr:uncharacterized protein K489DRAFT_380708 [Dissoconium aciculare CBS 342.82]KAF1821970.1 hypothetical protein K489DRAFT_380708 [Dissoconium aciculare CBS 342.82]
MADSQAIQAGHGVATFVPVGRVIKIVHNSELQSIDIWAFVLSKPEVRHPDDLEKNHPQSAAPQNTSVKGSKKKNVKASDLPSQDDAEKATKGYLEAIESKPDPPKKNTWASYVPTSYVPSLSFGKKKDDKNAAVTDDPEEETEQQKNSRTWASYIPTGKGFRSYIPDQAKDTLSDFAKSVSGSVGNVWK